MEQARKQVPEFKGIGHADQDLARDRHTIRTTPLLWVAAAIRQQS